jgi:hypothetical protein
MNRRRLLAYCVFAVGCLVGPAVANAGTITLFVGYADNLRPTEFFPNPWQGSPNVALFAGGGAQFDAGAIRVDNTGTTDVVIQSLMVTFLPGSGSPIPFNLWSGFLPFTLHPGQIAIFTQTGEFDFDTSDVPALVADDIANNCSVGPLSTSPTCVNNAPIVTLQVDGVFVSYNDTGHVLDTGGFDAFCCLPNGNESLNWRAVGTSGIENPGGGDVPEPVSAALLSSGLAALGVWRARRKASPALPGK